MPRPKGLPKTGGRLAGTPNKTTASVRKVFEQAFDGIGGVESLIKWGAVNRTEFYKLYGRLIPVDATITRIIRGADDLTDDELQNLANSNEVEKED